MINSDRRARMLVSCAMDGGDPAVAELVHNIGAEGAWAKIIEGVVGRAGGAAGRSRQLPMMSSGWLRRRPHVCRSRRRGVAGWA